MTQAPVSLDNPRSRTLWQILNAIPDEVLLDYLADQIVDEQEIDDITRRIGELCTQYDVSLTITPEDHVLLRQMVHHSVEHIQHQQRVEQKLQNQMRQINLQQVTQVMGDLLSTGHISIGGHDVDGGPTKGDEIPTERPEEYDENAPNTIEE